MLHHPAVSSPSIRPANDADIDAIVELVTSAYRGAASTAGWTTEHELIDGGRTTPELVRTAIDDPHGTVLVAELSGPGQTADRIDLAGCVEVSHVGTTARFGMLAVSPTLQASGTGSLLIEHAERYALDQWQCTVMELGVIIHRSELIAFYERRGYRSTGATIPFPYGDERYGIPRRDDLVLQLMQRPLG